MDWSRKDIRLRLRPAYAILLALTLSLKLILIGCAEEPRTDPIGNGTSTITLSGIVQAGRVSGADIGIYLIQNGQRGLLLGTTQTNSQGEYSIVVPAEIGPIEVVSTSGSYIDEATGETVVFDAADELTSILENATESQSVAITPISSLVRARVMELYATGAVDMNSFTDVKAAALAEVAEVWGTDTQTITSIPDPPDAPGESNSDEAKHTFLLATFSQFLKDSSLSPEDDVSPIDVMIHLNADFALDGRLDGVNNGAVMTGQFSDLGTGWKDGMTEARTNFINGDYGSKFESFTGFKYWTRYS